MSARAGSRIPAALPWLAVAPAACLLAVAFSYASTHQSGLNQFHLFWLGALLFVVPASIRLLSRNAGRDERLALSAAVGLFCFLPKYFRDPHQPILFDELAHWRQVQATLHDGRLFHSNPLVPIIQYFPGLHALTAALQQLTGLSTFAVGTLLLATLHSATVVGVFVIAEHSTGTARAAGVAALIFAVNPSFMYFDSQFAYESLALAFLVWTVAAALFINHARARRERLGWLLVGMFLGLACAVTHHITTYILVFILLMYASAALMRRRDERSLCLSILALSVAGAASAWLLLIASDTLAYLSPHFTGGLSQVLNLIKSEQSGRTLFGKTINPEYERVAAYAAPAIAFGLCLAGIRRSAWNPTAVVFTALGALYFASLPFALTQAGVQGAHRSWGFTYIGVAVLAAPVVVWLARRRLGVIAAVVSIAVLCVGNVAAGLEPNSRLPGPYVFGSDPRSQSQELFDMMRWFKRTQGTNRKIITDRYTGLVMASVGGEWVPLPEADFPAWQLYFQVAPPARSLMHKLQASNYRYLIVDRRMATHLPYLGYYFDPDEPLASSRRHPVPLAALKKFNFFPWTIKIFESAHLDVYRFDFNQFPSRGLGTK